MTMNEEAPHAPKPRGWLRAVAWAYVAVALFVFVGFATSRDPTATMGWYSRGYAILLAALAVLLASPLLLGSLLARHVQWSSRRARQAVIIVLTVYATGEILFSYKRRHLFDPFLQAPGTRFDTIPPGERPGVSRIVAIGGSVTRAGHMPREKRYPAVLQTLLNSPNGQQQFQVLNAGMDWWTTKHSHVNYVTYLRRWRPRTAIVMHAMNDLYRSCRPGRFSIGAYDVQWAHFYGPAIRGAHPGTFLESIIGGRTAWQLERRFYSSWRNRPVDYGLDRFVSLSEFEFSLRSLVRTLRQDSVRVVLLTEPFLYKEQMSAEESAALWFADMFCVSPNSWWIREMPSTLSMMRAEEAFNATIVRVGREEQVEVIDLAADLPRSLEFFVDDVHLTEKGTAAVAAAVAKQLKTAGVQPLRRGE